mmetsp:Transcript_52623/g.145519  ORF Transcript_52623/g.145519 Transcript_52623/m.145519 type:complete len:345 (-) Transcript_52623:306-1340(-)
MLAVPRPAALELVEDAIALVELAKLRSKVLVHLDRAHRLRIHVDVPYLERHVVARHDVPAVGREFHVGNRRDDLRKERFVGLRLRHVAEDLACSSFASRALAEIAQADEALAAAVDKLAVLRRVELGARDDLRQLLHIIGLNVHDVKRGGVGMYVPHVHAQVVGGEERRPVVVERERVDVVRVAVGVAALERRTGDILDGVERRHAQHQLVDERVAVGARPLALDGFDRLGRHHPDTLLEDLPHLDGLVVGREKEEWPGAVLAPADAVDLLLNLERLEVVELGLVALELAVEAVLEVVGRLARVGAAPRLPHVGDGVRGAERGFATGPERRAAEGAKSRHESSL